MPHHPPRTENLAQAGRLAAELTDRIMASRTVARSVAPDLDALRADRAVCGDILARIMAELHRALGPLADDGAADWFRALANDAVGHWLAGARPRPRLELIAGGPAATPAGRRAGPVVAGRCGCRSPLCGDDQ